MSFPYPDDDRHGRRRLNPGSRHNSYNDRPRSRSPAINIYNRNDGPIDEGRSRSRSRDRGRRDDMPPYGYPGYGYGPPMPMGYYPPPERHSHRHRRSRSRSRSRSHSRSRSPAEDPRIAKIDEQEQREKIIAEERRREEKERKDRRDAIEKYKADQERKEKEEKEAQDEAIRKHDQEKKDKAAEEKAIWEKYELKRKQEDEARKEKKKKEDDDYKKRMREHLAKAGYAPNQIDAIVAMENLKVDENNTPGTLVVQPSRPSNQLTKMRTNSKGGGIPGVRQQVFPKIRRKDIAVETLKHYQLEWDYCKDDTNYIVIMQELTEEDTDVLFYHTRKLREKEAKKDKKVLQIEERRGRDKEPQLLMVRRKSSAGRSKSKNRDRSRSRSFAGAVLGIKD